MVIIERSTDQSIMPEPALRCRSITDQIKAQRSIRRLCIVVITADELRCRRWITLTLIDRWWIYSVSCVKTTQWKKTETYNLTKLSLPSGNNNFFCTQLQLQKRCNKISAHTTSTWNIADTHMSPIHQISAQYRYDYRPGTTQHVSQTTLCVTWWLSFISM